MQNLKFKDKVKKKCKEFLAVTLISSSLLFVSCDNKEDNIYGNSDYVVVDNDDNKNDTDKNDTKPVNDEKSEEHDEGNELDEDLYDGDEDLIDEEISDDNCVFEESDEEILSNENTGTKYIVSSEAIVKEYEKDCFNYIKLAKLMSEHCESADKIDIETPSGKCYVPSYLTGNFPVQATSSCIIKLFLDTAEGSIKVGLHRSDPDLFYGRLDLLKTRLLYSYIVHEHVNAEDIRKIITYPYDNMEEKYLIPNYKNSFEYEGVPYKMLNEHLDVLHEMEFINTLNNTHRRYKFSMLWLYHLHHFPFFTLDLMKCPMNNEKEASIAVLGFLPNHDIIENELKYQDFMNGKCDEYFDKITEDFIRKVECD